MKKLNLKPTSLFKRNSFVSNAWMRFLHKVLRDISEKLITERECSFSYFYLGRIRKMLHSFRMHEALFTKKFPFVLNYFALIPAFWNLFSAIWNLLYEVVYVTVGNPAFCLFLYLTTVHFRGELWLNEEAVVPTCSENLQDALNSILTHLFNLYRPKNIRKTG